MTDADDHDDHEDQPRYRPVGEIGKSDLYDALMVVVIHDLAACRSGNACDLSGMGEGRR